MTLHINKKDLSELISTLEEVFPDKISSLSDTNVEQQYWARRGNLEVIGWLKSQLEDEIQAGDETKANFIN